MPNKGNRETEREYQYQSIILGVTPDSPSPGNAKQNQTNGICQIDDKAICKLDEIPIGTFIIRVAKVEQAKKRSN